MHSSEALDVADFLQEGRPVHMPVSSLREELAPLSLFGPTPRKLVLEGSAAPPTQLCSDFLCYRKRTTLEMGTSSLWKQLCFILGSSGQIPLPASLPRLKWPAGPDHGENCCGFVEQKSQHWRWRWALAPGCGGPQLGICSCSWLWKSSLSTQTLNWKLGHADKGELYLWVWEVSVRSQIIGTSGIPKSFLRVMGRQFEIRTILGSFWLPASQRKSHCWLWDSDWSNAHPSFGELPFSDTFCTMSIW